MSTIIVLIIELLRVLPLILSEARRFQEGKNEPKEITNATSFAFKFRNPEILRARLAGDNARMHQLIQAEIEKLPTGGEDKNTGSSSGR